MNASGCAAMVLEYGYLLRGDPLYAERARKLSERTRDVSQVLAGCAPELREQVKPAGAAQRVAFHPPCTLQNAKSGQYGGVRSFYMVTLGPAHGIVKKWLAWISAGASP